MSVVRRIHHVAYRCRDARETVEFYRDVLGMAFTTAFAEDRVPSTNEPDPYMHVFLDAGMGNVLAFFELPTREPMGRDPNTPTWVQHIAFKVDSLQALEDAKARFLGKSGRITELLKGLGALPAEQKKLRGAEIRVRRATAGEPFLPLGEHAQTIKLSPADLVIADAERPVALAGGYMPNSRRSPNCGGRPASTISRAVAAASYSVRRNSTRTGLSAGILFAAKTTRGSSVWPPLSVW